MSEQSRIILPERLPENPVDRKILGDFYDAFCTRQWFRGADIVEKHPTHMCKTLVVKVDYKPVAEMTEILNFIHPRQIALDWNVLRPDEQIKY